jgi:cytochrome P450
VSTAPRFDIDIDAFWRDPYPALAQMRAEAPIAFVPQLGATLLTTRDDIASMEKRVDVLSSDQPGGLMNRLMGQNMMRKDGAAHTAERNVYSPAIAPAALPIGGHSSSVTPTASSTASPAEPRRPHRRSRSRSRPSA